MQTMPQALTENSKEQAQGYPSLGLINTHADDAKRAEYPVLKVVHHPKTGHLYAHDPEAEHSNVEADVQLIEPAADFGLIPMTQWTHSNGSVYLCHGVAAVIGSQRAEYPLLVIYQDCSNGKLWGKSIKRFLQGMTEVGQE